MVALHSWRIGLSCCSPSLIFSRIENRFWTLSEAQVQSLLARSCAMPEFVADFTHEDTKLSRNVASKLSSEDFLLLPHAQRSAQRITAVGALDGISMT
jgi:hypothetical protein